MYPIINVLGVNLGTYGICAVIGLILLGLVSTRLNKSKFNICFEDTLLVLVGAAVVGFVCAHILYGITNIEGIINALSNSNEVGFIDTIKEIFIQFGGMVFYGGFIGGLLGIIIVCKIVKSLKGHAKDELDVYAVTFPLFHAFGRIGCFFAGCCYGIESEFGITVTGNTVNPSVNDVCRFPIQLVEAFLNLIIFFVMYYLIKNGKMKQRLIYVYMIIYGVVRFTDEFFRGDAYRGILFGLSTSQWISIILIAISIVSLIVIKAKSNKEKENTLLN